MGPVTGGERVPVLCWCGEPVPAGEECQSEVCASYREAVAFGIRVREEARP